MFLTNNDLLKIEQWLKQRAVKDSDLEKALPINGKELVPIIQNNRNVTIQADEMYNSLSLGKDNVINLTAYYDRTFSLTEAINMVIPSNRKIGTIITFINEENSWKNYQFVGLNLTNWADEIFWRDLYEEAKHHFKGFFTSKSALIKSYPHPEEGDYAYVGVYYHSSNIFRCLQRGEWSATDERPQGAIITQEFGNSESLVISLKAITNKINEIERRLGEKIESKEIIEN